MILAIALDLSLVGLVRLLLQLSVHSFLLLDRSYRVFTLHFSSPPYPLPLCPGPTPLSSSGTKMASTLFAENQTVDQFQTQTTGFQSLTTEASMNRKVLLLRPEGGCGSSSSLVFTDSAPPCTYLGGAKEPRSRLYMREGHPWWCHLCAADALGSWPAKNCQTWQISLQKQTSFHQSVPWSQYIPLYNFSVLTNSLSQK